jgi:hypothetical protein
VTEGPDRVALAALREELPHAAARVDALLDVGVNAGPAAVLAAGLPFNFR